MITQRDMSFREKGRLALLLLPYRPLRVCSVVAPSHPAFLAKTGAILFLKQALGKANHSPSVSRRKLEAGLASREAEVLKCRRVNADHSPSF